MNKEILKKIKKLNENSKFLLSVTVFDDKSREDNVDTFLFMNNFPKEELDGAKKTICKLIEDQKNK